MVKNKKYEKYEKDSSFKVHIRQSPMASPQISTRSSGRLLEAKSPEPSKMDSMSSYSSYLSSKERVAKSAKIVNQVQDVLSTKKVCKDTPLLTRVPISPGDVLRLCTQARKLIFNHSKTGSPSQPMRGKFLEESRTNDTREEEAEDNFQQGLAKKGKFIQEKSTDDYLEEAEDNFQQGLAKKGKFIQEKSTDNYLEEASENNIEPSLVKKGNCLQEKNYDTPEEAFEDDLQPCNKTTNLTQPEDHCPADFPRDMCFTEVTRSNNEVPINHNHTPSNSGMAITEIAALAGKNPLEEDEIASCYNPALVTVDGYRVRGEFASQSRSILQKYGDFLQSCSQKTTIARSLYLEMICGIIQTLQRSSFKEVTPGELKSMLKQVDDMESVGIPVEWLHKKLDEIYDAKTKFAGSYLVKEKKDRIRKDIGEVEMGLGHAKNMLSVLQNEMKQLRENIVLGEDKLASLKSEGKEIETVEIDTCTTVTSFLNNRKSLVDGLL